MKIVTFAISPGFDAFRRLQPNDPLPPATMPEDVCSSQRLTSMTDSRLTSSFCHDTPASRSPRGNQRTAILRTGLKTAAIGVTLDKSEQSCRRILRKPRVVDVSFHLAHWDGSFQAFF